MKLRKNVLQSIPFLDHSLTRSMTPVQQNALNSAVGRLECCEYGGLPAEDFPRSRASAQLPVDLLTEYESIRQESLLGRIFLRANELHALVDRVIILTPHAVKLSIETIQSACCQPYWNELSRAARGSKPRINLISDQSDNDSIQGLLDLLGSHQDLHVSEVNERWAVMLVCPEENGILADLYLKHFLPALTRQLRFAPDLIPRCSVVMVKAGSKMASVLQANNVEADFSLDRFQEPSGIFSEAALLPAALLGVNVMEFVGGAASLSMEGFKAGKAFANKMVRMAAANYASCSGEVTCYSQGLSVPMNQTRRLECFTDSLRSCDAWYQHQIRSRQSAVVQKLAAATVEEISKCEEDLSALAASDKLGFSSPVKLPLVHQIVTAAWRFDELVVAGFPECGIDGLEVTHAGALGQKKEMPAQTVPGHTNLKACLLHDERQGKLEPSTRIELPIVDELHTGYLVQWLLVAATLEEELLGSKCRAKIGWENACLFEG